MDRPSRLHRAGAAILVTGVPRSGTTWLARLLATAPGTALGGREPMNPRGQQYALAGTLSGWERLELPTWRQRFALRSAYLGVNPMVFSRYGVRQWAAPTPWTRMVVKDPFALLSLGAVSAVTGALPLVVVRHPGAILASYRRMGWTPDLDEIAPLVRRFLPGREADPTGDPATDMGLFWARLHELALLDIPRSGALVVFHEDLATGGASALQQLFSACALSWTPHVERRVQASWAAGESRPPTTDPGKLHNFDRAPAAVAAGWRSKVTPGELAALEGASGAVLARLQALRIDLSAPRSR